MYFIFCHICTLTLDWHFIISIIAKISENYELVLSFSMKIMGLTIIKDMLQKEGSNQWVRYLSPLGRMNLVIILTLQSI